MARWLLLICLSWIIRLDLLAQDERLHASDSLALRGNSYGMLGIRYVSDAVFMGQKDAIPAPYLTPHLNYFHHSGWYVDASFSYLTREQERRVDLYLLSAGYQFDGNWWSTGLSATQYFYNDQSYTVKSQLTTDLSAFLGFHPYLLDVYVDGSVFLSAHESTDLIAGVELSRTFHALNRNLRLTPSAYLSFGTRYYYEAYYQNVRQRRKGKQYGKNQGMHDPDTDVFIEDTGKIKALAVEMRLPLSYSLGAFRFLLTPMVAFPLAEQVVIEGPNQYPEDTAASFFWSTGIQYFIRPVTK